MNAEVSRIFLGRSRGRGNGVANENGSRQGKLIRSGAMTREKLRSEMDEQLSLPPPPFSTRCCSHFVFSTMLFFAISTLRCTEGSVLSIREILTCRIIGLFVRREDLV